VDSRRTDIHHLTFNSDRYQGQTLARKVTTSWFLLFKKLSFAILHTFCKDSQMVALRWPPMEIIAENLELFHIFV